MFGTNVGQIDRVTRAVVGTSLVAWSAWRLARGTGRVLPALGVLAGATLLFTAATRSCPIYTALGISTSD
jgi:uncharacterized membrane protein